MDAALRNGTLNGEGGLIMGQKDELIAQSNALTSSRYNFSPTEKNVIYHIIKKVRQDYIEGTMQPVGQYVCYHRLCGLVTDS